MLRKLINYICLWSDTLTAALTGYVVRKTWEEAKHQVEAESKARAYLQGLPDTKDEKEKK